jgi:quinohemoprotein amine dehydrogenase
VEWTEDEQGIPVTDRLTTQKCGSCHRPDDEGNLSRISWIRATPEGWSQTIKRMVNLHGLSISPEEARGVVRYLGTQHGLAPEEAKDVMYMVERRVITESNIPNADVRQACASCHAFGQVLSSRRSRREWALLQNMHVALYSQAEAQFQGAIASAQGDEARGTDEPAARRVTRREAALDWLSENAPLQTAEWAEWRPRIRVPQLAGTWVVSATLPGHGRYVGEMSIKPAADPTQFTTVTTLRSLDTGETMTREGTGLVYAGYSWRGGSAAGSAAGDQPDDPNHALREAMWFSPDQGTAEGRWYWGDYHEFGFDVSLTRATDRPGIAAVSPGGLKAGSTNQSVHIYGVNLPTGLQPQDLDLGAGVTVTGISSGTAQEIVATVNVAGDAVPGLRDVGIRGTTLVKALPVYDRVDFLKISPETSIARLGGLKYTKGYSQFVATGYANGPDGKPDTADDVPIGPIEADWKIDEFPTVTYDDDKAFVGTMGARALFTPAAEGPNPERRFSRNNYGEVWVVATAKNEKDELGQPLTGRSYLVVTVPTYRRWDQPEVSQ